MITPSWIEHPWLVRRLLYTAASAGMLVVVAVQPNIKTAVVLILGLGGVLTGLSIPAHDEPPQRHGLALGFYDLAVAFVLAALGLHLTSLLMLVGASATLSLLYPETTRMLSIATGAIGSGAVFLALVVGDSPSPIEIEDPRLAVLIPMVALGLVTGGITSLFGAVGMRLRRARTAEEALRASLDRSAIPTVVVDGTSVVYANPAAIVLAGQGLVGEDIEDVLGIDMGRLMSGTATKVTLSSSEWNTVTVQVRATPLTFDGRLLTSLALHDVSDVPDPEGVLSMTRRQFDLLFDRIPVALYRSTPDGDVIAANPALADMLGLDQPEDLVRTVDRARQHYADARRRSDWLGMFEDRDVVMNYEIELSRADGTTLVATDSARAIRDRDGTILFFEGVLADVTEQREAERARKRNSEILEATSDLVWITDQDDRISRVNAAMRAFLGGGYQVQIPVRDVVVSGAGADSLFSWRASADSAREWRGELELRSLDGRVILTSAVAQRHAGFVSLVARDITEERRTAGQLERLVRAKDEFIASVSHELRTPLTAVVGLASELADSYDELDDATKRDFIRLVSDQAAEVAAIVEDLLVAARADSESITLVHEHPELRRAVDAVLAGLPESTTGMFEVTGDGTACGDAQRVRQVIRNLVTNAMRYGELPGSVAITREGGEIVVTVADKGPGIDPSVVERIFQPYERAHSAVTQPNSVGLGLSVSRWLAEKMGGSLVYENGAMSTFILRLPAACT